MASAGQRAAATRGMASGDAAVAGKAKKDLAALDKAVAKAKADLEKWGDETTSFMGLEKPLFELKNPGLISIPLGFLAVILGSLFVPRQTRRGDVERSVCAAEHRSARIQVRRTLRVRAVRHSSLGGT